IVESTLAPGTMQRLVAPLLEEASGLQAHSTPHSSLVTHHSSQNSQSGPRTAPRLGAIRNSQFHLVHCPERVMPGKLLANIENCHRVVGGMTPEAAEAAVALYRHIVRADLDTVDCLTAELVKTAENAYRDVQIAFANEVALLCEDLNADVWRVRELVNKSPYRTMHLPGAGVGGHCIPKDPWLLISGASDGFEPRLIPAARAVNDGMPLHVADLVAGALAEAGRAIQGARVAVLGYAYIENSDDTRNSPSIPLVALLKEWGAEVVVHDPWVRSGDSANPGVLLVQDVGEAVRGADAIVLMVAHEEYRRLSLAEMRQAVRTPALVDGRHVFEAEEAKRAGFIYRAVGIGRETIQPAS
ncbi:MAG: nucleotide sugar dehydrogenase, partial [Chloroflexi bacterium]|nr:nucleotide sugar dehydrogenase [Chloroflexota bacterium]